MNYSLFIIFLILFTYSTFSLINQFFLIPSKLQFNSILFLFDLMLGIIGHMVKSQMRWKDEIPPYKGGWKPRFHSNAWKWLVRSHLNIALPDCKCTVVNTSKMNEIEGLKILLRYNWLTPTVYSNQSVPLSVMEFNRLIVNLIK